MGAGLPFPLCFPNKPSRNSRANKYFASISTRVNDRFYDKIDFFQSWYMFGDISWFHCFTNSDIKSFTFIFIDKTSFLTTVHVQQLKSLKDDGSTMNENWGDEFWNHQQILKFFVIVITWRIWSCWLAMTEGTNMRCCLEWGANTLKSQSRTRPFSFKRYNHNLGKGNSVLGDLNVTEERAWRVLFAYFKPILSLVETQSHLSSVIQYTSSPHHDISYTFSILSILSM